MKRYRMRVRRRTDEWMLFTTEAESPPQAHEIAKADVLAGKHPGQSKRVEASVETCHEVLDDGDSSAV